ncbi:hypothetical protein ACROYT_G014964 [Oculina patagonica]
MPAFAKVMTRKRFLDLLYNIHVNDNSKIPAAGSDQYDKLYKIRPFLKDLKTNFKVQNNPHREQAVDEAMVKYKGRTSLIQYMPMKRIKRGIKLWCRADSTNGYLCDFDVYTAQSDDQLLPNCVMYYQDLRYHQCYIQNPLNVEEKQKRKRTSDGRRKEPEQPVFVSWDGEARQEEGQHMANLICTLRGDTDEEKTFERETCVKDFIDWFREIGEQHHVIAVAHNFQGYDSYFILNELYAQAICPDQIVNGA